MPVDEKLKELAADRSEEEVLRRKNNPLSDILTGLGAGVQGRDAGTAIRGARKERLGTSLQLLKEKRAGQARRLGAEEKLESRASAAALNDPLSSQSKRVQDVLLGIFRTDKEGDSDFIRGLSAQDVKDFGIFDALSKVAAEKGKRQIERDKISSAEKLAGMQKRTADRLDLTPGQRSLDVSFAKEISDFIVEGGSADIQKSLDQLKASRKILEEENVTGAFTNLYPFKRLTNPQAIEVRENIEEVVQRNLRLILGAQFTEKEGARLIERAFNPNLSEETNIVRLDRLIKSIQDAAEAKAIAADYFQTTGTLKGFAGEIPTFDKKTANIVYKKSTGESAQTAITEADVDNMSIEELKAAGLI
jgi:hypothetical protein